MNRKRSLNSVCECHIKGFATILAYLSITYIEARALLCFAWLSFMSIWRELANFVHQVGVAESVGRKPEIGIILSAICALKVYAWCCCSGRRHGATIEMKASSQAQCELDIDINSFSICHKLVWLNWYDFVIVC